MPISKKDFERGIDETTSQFLKIFKDNPDKAFTLKDLEEYWNIHPIGVVFVAMVLRDMGLIKAKFIGLEWYYTLV
jgi:hypothetical protein